MNCVARTAFCLAYIAAFILAGIGTAFSQAETPDDDAALVHFGDVIEVDMVGSLEFDWRGGLDPEGFLDGLEQAESPVFALCRSESEIASDVEKAYSKLLREPKAVVRILDRSNRALAYLDGAVRLPARFRIKRKVLLSELLVLAGGITDKASGEISIYRPHLLSCTRTSGDSDKEWVKTSQRSGARTISIRLGDVLKGRADANIEILSGDIVTVVEALPIYVIGGVNSPRQIPSRQKTTLSRAVAAAGGVAKDGSAKTVYLYRREGTETRTQEFNLEKIHDGEADDPLLLPKDIVEVARRGGGKSKLPPSTDEARKSADALARMPLRIIE